LLADNYITGRLPDSVNRMAALKVLNVSGNQISDVSALNGLARLVNVDISDNLMTGDVPVAIKATCEGNGGTVLPLAAIAVIAALSALAFTFAVGTMATWITRRLHARADAVEMEKGVEMGRRETVLSLERRANFGGERGGTDLTIEGVERMEVGKNGVVTSLDGGTEDQEEVGRAKRDTVSSLERRRALPVAPVVHVVTEEVVDEKEVGGGEAKEGLMPSEL
ncbi:hypothetical protein HK101_004394, partial [Irineochytrium annulatum]